MQQLCDLPAFIDGISELVVAMVRDAQLTRPAKSASSDEPPGASIGPQLAKQMSFGEVVGVDLMAKQWSA